MNYLKMLPYQIKESIEKKLPVLLPIGVLEYHGEHLPLGVDSLICINALERVEKRQPDKVVLLPPFYYGAASYAVAGAEGTGTVHVDAKNILPVAENIFHSLLKVGFRKIIAFYAHQTEEFIQGMPTDLAFRLAAKNVIFSWLESEAGKGWWGKEENSNYYSGVNSPFNWIRVFPIRTRESTKKNFPGDHAGVLETSQCLEICPESVEMERLDDSIWYTRSAKTSSREFGEAALETSADDIEKLIFG